MIVSRGLGQGLAGALVAAGLCLSIPVVIVPPPIAPEGSRTIFGYSGQTGKVVPIQRTRASVRLPLAGIESLFAAIEARGAASAALLEVNLEALNVVFKVSGAATASVIAVSSETQLGAMLAEGKHDLSDEELLAMILALTA